jgi:hypothetical protein
MNRRNAILLALWLALPAGGYAAEHGTVSGLFLRLPPSAAGAGMGEAGAAVVAGSPAIFVNPAGLAGVKGGYASFTHSSWADSLTYNAVSAAVKTRSAGVFGVGLRYLSYGEMDAYDNTGVSAGGLAPRDLAAEAAWATELNWDRTLGVSVKYINSKIVRNASAFAMDFGIMQRVDRVFLGAALQNSGGGLKYGEEAYPLPLNLKLGVGVPYGQNLLAAFDLNVTRGANPWAAAGVKYTLPVSGGASLSLRAGYNTASGDTGGVNGFSAGFGLAGESLAVDYALRTMGELGLTHHLGLSYRWEMPGLKVINVREYPPVRDRNKKYLFK